MKPGSVVYLTAFVSMDEMYIRKWEDYNDEFHNLLDKINEFCSSGKYEFTIKLWISIYEQ